MPLELPTVADKKKKPSDPTVTVKILASIHRKAKIVAAHKEIDVSEYLSAILDKPVDRDYKRTAAEIGEEVKDDSEDS